MHGSYGFDAAVNIDSNFAERYSCANATRRLRPRTILVHQAVSRFFDTHWRDRPGGAAADLAAPLARHAAALHGARLEIASRAGAGTRIAMAFDQ